MSKGGMTYVLSQAQLNSIVELASSKGSEVAIETFRKEKEKLQKSISKQHDHVARAKRMLAGYRRVKAALREEEELTVDEIRDLRFNFLKDLMETPMSDECRTENIVKDKIKSRKKNLYSIHCIEKALELYRAECERSDSEEDKRRFRELYLFYIAEDGKSVVQIAEEENVSEKTVYKDINISCAIMATYMLGV